MVSQQQLKKDTLSGFKEELTMLRTDELLIILSDYPTKLLNNEIELLKKKTYINNLKNRISRIEASVEIEVLKDSKKEEWKESLSNQQKRDVEKKNRLQNNLEHQELSIEQESRDEEYIIASYQLQHDERVWQSSKAMAYLMSNR